MRIYFSGIGGVGIGPLAMIALDAGFKVTGSDKEESELSRQLEARGVEITYQQDGKRLADTHKTAPIDWLVYSSALPDDHPELTFAKENNLKISKRAEFLNMILKEKNLKLIAVSGTHGKTTTTGMVIWLFKQLGVPVSYSVGTTLSFGPAGQYVLGSNHFVYECDEFDKNFLLFSPDLSIITSMDYDHPDTYPTEETYVQAFRQFVKQSKLAIAWQSVAKKLQPSSSLLPMSEDRDFNRIKLTGQLMRRNAWLAVATINRVGLVEDTQNDWNKLFEIVSTFPGTNRRFEKLADNLYSDYAHHPVEIAATIDMAKELNPNIVVVYQPHQNIRQHELVNSMGYEDCFNGTKKVYWLPTYLSREYQNLPIVESAELIKSADSKTESQVAELNDDLWQNITAHQQSGDLVVAMSAGDLDLWLRQQLNKN